MTFDEWSKERPTQALTRRIANPAPYVPGEFRIPTLLKRVDRLCREAPAQSAVQAPG